MQRAVLQLPAELAGSLVPLEGALVLPSAPSLGAGLAAAELLSPGVLEALALPSFDDAHCAAALGADGELAAAGALEELFLAGDLVVHFVARGDDAVEAGALRGGDR